MKMLGGGEARHWVRFKNLCLVGSAGTGKSRLLVAPGHAIVSAGRRVHHLT